MKKYIRAKNNIYELKIDEDVNCYFVETSPNTAIFFEEEELKLYKQADNIEDLCDAYICVYNNGNNHDIYSSYVIDTKDMKLTKNKNNNWYAAIWTDEGLIYVAKLNKDGELELLWVKD